MDRGPRLLERGSSAAGGERAAVFMAVAAPCRPPVADRDEVRSALAAIPQEGVNALPRPQWINICFALKYEYGQEGFSLWEEFSRRYVDNSDDEIVRCWNTCRPDGHITIGSVFHMATQHGWSRRAYESNRNTAVVSHLRDVLAASPTAAASTAAAVLTPPTDPVTNSPAIVSGVGGGVSLQDYANANRVTSVAPAADLPPVEWLLKYVHACKYVGVTAGSGGLNKTQLSLVEAVSIASGIDLLNYGGVCKSKVLLFNKEESRLDIRKRLRAIVLRYREELGLRREEVDGFDFHGNLVIVSGRSLPLMLGSDQHGEWKIDVAAFQALAELITNLGARHVVIDPLLLFHGLNENDNMQKGALTTALGQMAEDLDICIEIIAHTRKGGEAGDIDNVRGASALIAHARRGRVLTRMTLKEAGALGVPTAEAGYYFRIDNGKANLLPPAERARWFKSATVRLDNQTSDRPADAYGVPERFVPRPVLSAMTHEQVTVIYEAAGGEPAQCRAYYRAQRDGGAMAGWFGDRVTLALGWEIPATGTSQHTAYLAAMRQRLEALVECGVLVIEEVRGAGSQAREAHCYRQGTLPTADQWTTRQALEMRSNANR